jgi:hypothetical protein
MGYNFVVSTLFQSLKFHTGMRITSHSLLLSLRKLALSAKTYKDIQIIGLLTLCMFTTDSLSFQGLYYSGRQ